MKKLGIIGCGNIGSNLACSMKDQIGINISDIICFDTDKKKLSVLEQDVPQVSAAGNIEEVFESADIVAEAVSPFIVGDLLRKAFQYKVDLMIMSIGGILGNEDILREAVDAGIRIILPSGAIAGIDALKAAGISGLKSVALTTKKPPLSLKGAEYLAENNIDIDSITSETVIFEGTAEQAIKKFPKNINVSVLLSLAGLGPDRTSVRIVTSPEFQCNMHEVEIVSESGKIFTRTENKPSPNNPKTSYLAVLSGVRSLKDYFSSLSIGT